MAYYDRPISSALLTAEKAMEFFRQLEGMEASKVRAFLLSFNNIDLERFAVALGIPDRTSYKRNEQALLLNAVEKEVLRRKKSGDFQYSSWV